MDRRLYATQGLLVTKKPPIKTSDKAKHAMKMFDVLRRRGCLNIVQQASKFPPMADKRLIKVTVDSSATEKPLLPASLFSKSTLPYASIYTVNSV